MNLTFAEAILAQIALREKAGLSQEAISLQRFIAMAAHEIEELWAMGVTDEEIVSLITEATGRPFSGEDITKFLDRLNGGG